MEGDFLEDLHGALSLSLSLSLSLGAAVEGDGVVGSSSVADEEDVGRRRHPPRDEEVRADAAEGGGEHVRVRGRARDVGAANGVATRGAGPDAGSEEEDEAPAARDARVGRF
ncbi:hypothetical protein Cni_G01032 [Canna indica]|uniref:Uncharacterized protein n=1 Tax=Canna indica TaxID=4628 RepID=A0AAQ3JMC6_9LILI|nr:hypothetical protein Cni_G01032 [Canna indica]